MQLILAADENWGIGKGGELLCHIPGDLKYFKEKTMGKTMIMGRATLESLPGKKGLPGRRNFVLTSDRSYEAENAIVVHDTGELMAALSGTDPDEIMVMGGERVYREFLPRCGVCYITRIYASFDADRFFVNLDDDPSFVSEAIGGVHEENGIRYQFFKYTRKDD